jgi:hypothetical protein
MLRSKLFSPFSVPTENTIDTEGTVSLALVKADFNAQYLGIKIKKGTLYWSLGCMICHLLTYFSVFCAKSPISSI